MNARELAHSLLAQIETRGTHASGFAWQSEDGTFGYYKQPKPGSQLSLAELPRNAKTVILHTRYATQGDRMDNRNNHPVLSTDNSVAVVHNGVIYNDHTLRSGLGITAEHGEVDSLVIPTLIADHGIDSLSSMTGYAAIAWLDSEEGGVLNIARLKSSPVAYTHLYDGTFVMASTPALLEVALLDINAVYGGIFEMPEGKHMQVTGGFIHEYTKAPSMTYSAAAYARFSGATSGGHAKSATPPAKAVTAPTAHQSCTTQGSEDQEAGLPRVYRRADGTMVETNVPYGSSDDELEQWRAQRAKADLEGPMVLFGQTVTDEDADDDGDPVTDNWDAIVARLEAEELVASLKDQGFYLVDYDHDISHHETLDDLEAALAAIAANARTDMDLFDVDPNVNWVNHIMDLGSVHKDGVLESWVEDSADIDNYESPAVRNLQYIREGVGYLDQLRGA